MDAPPVQYVRTRDGFDIAYSLSGEGRPVVLMPAPISHVALEWSSESYGPFLRGMSERYRLVRFDNRGSGMSSRNLPEDLSLQDFATDLEAVLNEVGLYRAVLFGRVLNGNVAVKYALDHPERVEALVLWNTLRHYRDSFAHSHLELARTHWEHVLATAGGVYFPREDPTLATEMTRLMVAQQDFRIRAKAAARLSVEGDAAKLRLPVLILASHLDGQRVTSEAQDLAALIPGARLHIFGRGGGIIPDAEEEPEALALTDRFIASLDEPTDGGSRVPRLSKREMEVLKLVAAGKSNQQIADELVITGNTVARHLSNVFDKTGVANRAEAAAFASRHRLA